MSCSSLRKEIASTAATSGAVSNGRRSGGWIDALVCMWMHGRVRSGAAATQTGKLQLCKLNLGLDRVSNIRSRGSDARL